MTWWEILFGVRYDPKQDRLHRLKRLLRKPMTFKPFSVDPRGTWSPVQAQRVLEIIQPEAFKRGLEFHVVDITTHAGPRRSLLSARCKEHQVTLQEGEACPECLTQ